MILFFAIVFNCAYSANTLPKLVQTPLLVWAIHSLLLSGNAIFRFLFIILFVFVICPKLNVRKTPSFLEMLSGRIKNKKKKIMNIKK